MRKICFTDEQILNMQRLYDGGLSMRDIVNRMALDCSPRTVGRIIKRHGGEIRKPHYLVDDFNHDELKKILELYQSGETMNNIAQIIGHGTRLQIRSLLLQFNANIRPRLIEEKFTDDEFHQMKRLYDEGYGTTEIAEAMPQNINAAQVYYALKKTGVQFRAPYRGRPQKSVPLSTHANDIITGMLLGDGGLFPIIPPHKNSALNASQTERRKDFMLWLQTKLAQEHIPSRICRREKTVTGNPSVTLYTTRTKEFTALRYKWYPAGKKCVPSDISLSPITLLCWYLGDGTKYKSTNAIQLYTNSFTFTDVELLKEALLTTFDIGSTVHSHIPGPSGWAKEPQGAVPVLYIPKTEAQKFFAVIGSCPVESMQYKWPDQS